VRSVILSGPSEGWVYTPTPSAQTYVPLLTAFSHFNRTLFRGGLPDCLITLQRKANTYGYFSPDKFAAIGDAATTAHEIAMNPAHFGVRTPKDVCSTLVHEMAHLWQQCFGEPSRSGYHNRQWVAVMHRIGLTPVSANGKGTGYSVTHSIVDGGPFDLSFQAFAANPTIAWGDAATPVGASMPGGAKQKPKRLTFVCPSCSQKVMGVPSTRVRCEFCGLPMTAREVATSKSTILEEPSLV
jgi:SprT-like family